MVLATILNFSRGVDVGAARRGRHNRRGIQHNANLGSRAVAPDDRDSPSVGEQQMVAGRDRPRPIPQAWGMHALLVAQEYATPTNGLSAATIGSSIAVTIAEEIVMLIIISSCAATSAANTATHG